MPTTILVRVKSARARDRMQTALGYRASRGFAERELTAQTAGLLGLELTMRQPCHPLVTTFSKSMRAAYRRLRRNADILGRVLVYDAGPYQELALLYPAEADDLILLHRRVVLYDPRQQKQQPLFPA